MSNETVENTQKSSYDVRKKSIRKCVKDLCVPKTTFETMFYKNCSGLQGTNFKFYTLRPGDNMKSYNFAVNILDKFEVDMNF